MFTLKKTFSILSIAALLLVACATDGDTGPAGPVGPEGALGPAGQDGTIGRDGIDGVDGKDGVIPKARTFIVDTLDWTAGRAPKSNIDITQAVIDGGSVLAYRTPNPPGPNSVWTNLYDGTFNYSYQTGTVTFLTPGFTGAGFITYFKVVVIPPAAKIAGFDPKNYEEVKMVYGLED